MKSERTIDKFCPMRTSFFRLAFAVCFTATLAAQDANNEKDAKDVKGRVASFVYTSLPDGLENPVTVMTGETISQVVLSKLSPSDPVKVPADGVVRIVRKLDNPENPDKPFYRTLASATIPKNVSKAIIILAPAVKNSNDLVFQTRVLDLDMIKGGDSLFLNMTTLKIGVDLGKTKILIEPGQIEIHNPLGDSKAVTLPIRLSYYHAERGVWAMITASTVALYSTRRELCIFIWDNRFSRVDYESITLPTL